MQIVLASTSKLRNLIMHKSGLNYQKVDPGVDETQFDDMPIGERVQRISLEKCQAVQKNNPHDSFVIAADTLTANMDSGVVFSKPLTRNNPLDMALSLSGATIDVFSGITIWHASFGYKTHLATSRITYQHFDRQTLERVSANDKPATRSGALGAFYDAPGFTLIENISGSYTGTFGLPMEFVNACLTQIDYRDNEVTS